MKEFLSQKGVKFIERDISKDEEAMRELTEKYHLMTTPVTVIADDVVVGFDRQKLEQSLREEAI
ncbi:MAG: glutaredoxin domain-containing protein [bacterium]